MIHLADHTYSNIVSKSVSRNGGEVNYRGLVLHGPNAAFAKSKVECDTLILDKQSRSDTIPTNISKNMTSQIEHEATVSNISEEQLFLSDEQGIKPQCCDRDDCNGLSGALYQRTADGICGGAEPASEAGYE